MKTALKIILVIIFIATFPASIGFFLSGFVFGTAFFWVTKNLFDEENNK